VTLREAQVQDSTFPVVHAVKGMLQHNSLGADMLKRLRVYAGPEHEQQAQQPKTITFNSRGDIDLG
jgi:large subunit ribosomal protein L13